MKSERWQQINDLFQAAAERTPEDRAAFLDEACHGDESLCREVESLIASSERAENFIEAPAFEIAPELLTNERTGALVGELVGHYRIESLIGVGGMGEVYLARDERLGRKVALKFLPESLIANEAQLNRLEHEARTASALNHPNILTVHEIGVDGRRHFIATEFIEGETLRAVLARGKLDLRDTLNIAIQVGSALTAAHKSGVLHRDIKPENIMLRPDAYVKVLDFGIAKLTEQKQGIVSAEARRSTLMQTESGLVVGTAHYMSPEQARGQTVDARTDIWSFGVVLYEMLAGSPPFEGATPSDCIAAVLKTEPPPLPLKAPQVPAQVEKMVRKALRKNKEERYQSVEEMLAELRAVKEGLERKKKPGQRALLVMGVAALCLLAVAAWYFARPKSHIAPPSQASAIPEKSIAVLPFADLSQGRDQQYFCDGIQQEILARLSKIHDLKVISRTSTQHFKGAPQNLPEIAKQLGVTHILEGTVQKTTDQVRINVQLINAKNDSHLWADKYDRKFTDIFAVESEIATKIADTLQAKLTGAEQKALSLQPTENPEAHQFYLKARFYWNRRGQEGLKKAVEYFEQAIKADPNYALAYAGMADSYALLGFHGWGVLPPAEAVPKAKAAAEKALQIDETLAEAHASLAFAKEEYDWDVAGAEREYRRAIELNPNYATAHHWYALHLAVRGRYPEAIAEIKKAQELDPLSLIINMDVGWVFYFARQYDEAVEQCRKTLELDPNFPPAHWMLGQAYRQKGMHDEAIAEFQKAVALSGGEPIQVAVLGHGYAVAGNRAEAQKILNDLKELSKRRYFPPYFIALIYVGLNDKNQAFEWLEKAFAERSANLTVLKAEPMFDPIRSDPRFQDLLHRVGFQ